MTDLIESHSIDYVPIAERRGKPWHLWTVWFTANAQLVSLATGMLGVALGLNLAWAALATITGCLFGTFFMAFHSAQGPQLGLPQMIQSRPQFGYFGALLVWVVALLTYVGYSAFNLLLVAQTGYQLTNTGHSLAIAGTTAVAVVLAVAGYDLIHKAQRWLAVPLLLALLVFTVKIPFEWHLPASQLHFGAVSATVFLAQFFAAASYQVSWAIYVSDYSRYLPRRLGAWPTFWWNYTGAFIGAAWTMLIGAVVAAMYPGVDLAAATSSAGNAVYPGFGTVLLIGSLLALISLTSLNFYGSSLTLLSIFDSVANLRASRKMRVATVLLIGLVTAAIALYSSDRFMAQFRDFLAILLYLFTPWTSINLLDFYFVRKGHYSIREMFNRNGLYGRWNAGGLLAYAGGFIAMIPFFSTSLYTGPVARALGGADIAMLVGLPISGALYLMSCRSIDIETERARVDVADENVDPDLKATPKLQPERSL